MLAKAKCLTIAPLLSAQSDQSTTGVDGRGAQALQRSPPQSAWESVSANRHQRAACSARGS